MLLAGKDGPAYFLVPVMGDVVAEDRELRRAMAKASLRKTWRAVEASGAELTDEEIEEEIRQARAGTQRANVK